MKIEINETTKKTSIISSNGECLAEVDDMKIAEELFKIYQNEEDDYYNSIDFHTNPKPLSLLEKYI